MFCDCVWLWNICNCVRLCVGATTIIHRYKDQIKRTLTILDRLTHNSHLLWRTHTVIFIFISISYLWSSSRRPECVRKIETVIATNRAKQFNSFHTIFRLLLDLIADVSSLAFSTHQNIAVSHRMWLKLNEMNESDTKCIVFYK